MKPAVLTFALAACTTGSTEPSATSFTDGGEDRLATPGTHVWTFDDGMPPELFNVLGDWVVQNGELVQRGSFADPDFPRMLIEDLSVADFHLSVKCKSDAGSVDRACGLVFRAVDSENYFITRANALEDNVRLYRVVDGARISFASADTAVDGGYHTLEVDARGAHLEVSWDRQVVISSDDETFVRGAIGVWTKADSRVRFDDLVLEAR